MHFGRSHLQVLELIAHLVQCKFLRWSRRWPSVRRKGQRIDGRQRRKRLRCWTGQQLGYVLGILRLFVGSQIGPGHFRHHLWAAAFEQLVACLVDIGNELLNPLDDDAEGALAGFLSNRNENIMRVHQLGNLLGIDGVLRVVEYQRNRKISLCLIENRFSITI